MWKYFCIYRSDKIDWLWSGGAVPPPGPPPQTPPMDPTQISREVLPLLPAGVGGQKILRETHGERWDLECNRNVIETHEVEKKIQATVYLTKAKQGKSDI